MTLMKLRRNFSQIDLGVRFNLSHTAVSNVLHTWLSALHCILVEGLLPSAPPSLANNKASLPSCFATFSSCRMILDCTEVEIAIPMRTDAQSFTYSHYKHRNTFKGLVGVAPNGVVTFASKLYPSSTSDKEVVRHSKALDMMEPGDMVLADKGFLIHDLMPAGVSLNLPPFLSTPQFTVAQAKLTSRIARARIHVERAIQRIKLFAILDYIPHQLRSIASDIFQVCAMLTNLCNPLLKEIESAAAPSVSSSVSAATSDSDPARVSSPGLSQCASVPLQLSSASRPSPPVQEPGLAPATGPAPTAHALVAIRAVSTPEQLPAAPDNETVHVFYLPYTPCQSRIDGRSGSNACTVIACLMAIRLCASEKEDINFSKQIVDSFVEIIRQGNHIYYASQARGMLLSVYDALDILPGTPLRVAPHSDFSMRSGEDLTRLLEERADESVAKKSMAAATLIQTPFTILLLFLPSRRVVVFDSHSHGHHGSLIAILPSSWSTAVRFLETFVRTISDGHVYVLELK